MTHVAEISVHAGSAHSDVVELGLEDLRLIAASGELLDA